VLTCPYETTTVEETVTKTITSLTTVTCESSGIYTPVPPTTTVCETSTYVVYPVPWVFTPSVYTRPATTVTATVTEEVFVCPYEGYTSTTYITSTSVVLVSASPVATTPTAPENVVTSSAAPAPYSGGKSSGITTNGNKWAVAYTPYTSSGQCKTADEVMADITIIAGKGFKAVRIYATDCSGLENVGAACAANGLTIIIGIFIESSGTSGAQSQVTEIIEWGSAGNWGLVEMCVIGNEAIFNNYCTAEELAEFISSCKSALTAAGYNGPCTTTEPLDILQASAGALCDVIDVVASNIEVFFNGGIAAEDAGEFVAGQLQLTGECCPGKTAYNLECGWPSAGSSNGAAVPGSAEQAAAIGSILSSCGENTVFFSFSDDAWKAPGPFGVEQFFGCIDSL